MFPAFRDFTWLHNLPISAIRGSQGRVRQCARLWVSAGGTPRRSGGPRIRGCANWPTSCAVYTLEVGKVTYCGSDCCMLLCKSIPHDIAGGTYQVRVGVLAIYQMNGSGEVTYRT